MNEEQAKELLARYRQGTCTEEERIAIEAWMDQEVAERSWDISPEDKMAFGQSLKNRIDLVRLAEANQDIPERHRSVAKLWPRIAIAASILLCCSIGLYIYKQKTPTEQVQLAQNQIKPGGNKAILTLANGKKIVLTGAANGTLAKQSGVQVIKSANGQLTYTIVDVPNNTHAIEYNTIETPKGGQYQVHLPDGTDVWLNAASTLKYPTSFSAANTRTVELTGEAYFQVAKDKAHPFTVKTAKEEITVLGTHFNVNTYNDEPAVKTTLLEGSVKVTAGTDSKLIIPGQNAILSNGVLTVAKANVEEAVAWKNGYFRFNDEKIESIMRRVARWYDVEIEYQGDVTNEGFNGAITRYSNINDVLGIMEGSKAVHFKISGRRIIVTK